jgi:hypothetical protein
MKKLSLMMLSALFLLVACNKENQQESFRSITLNSQLNDAGKNEFYNSVTIDGVTKFNDMLWFKDQESFLKAEEALRFFQEQDIDIFNEKYIPLELGNLDDLNEVQLVELSENLEKIEKEIGFSEWGIYSQLEAKLNFISLRKTIEDKMNTFLENSNPDWDKNPENHFISTDALRTLFNQYGEVKIANSIFVVAENGTYEITNGDYETALQLRKSKDISNFSEVKFLSDDMDDYTGKIQSECLTNKEVFGYTPKPDNTRRIYWKLRHNTTFWVKSVMAEVTHYSKKSNGNWTKSKAYLGVSIAGNTCHGYSVNKAETPKKMKKSITVRNNNIYGQNVQNNAITGVHIASGCCTKHSTLTW